MQDEISFVDFDRYVEKDKYKQATLIAYEIFREDLNIRSRNANNLRMPLEKFFKKYEGLSSPWLADDYATIAGLKNGRLGEDAGRRLLFWLFLNYPHKCERLAQHLWSCSTLAEHHKSQQLLKYQFAHLGNASNATVGNSTAVEQHLVSTGSKIKNSVSEFDRVTPSIQTNNVSNFPVFVEPKHSDDIHSYAYKGPNKIPVLGRKQEEEALERFIRHDTDKLFKWLQLAGVAGQGKTRLALELIEKARSDSFGNWNAGFWYIPDPKHRLESEIAEFREFWRNWLPDAPYLLVLDYVTASGSVLGEVISSLLCNVEHFNFPVRLLLLERQRWDRGGLMLKLSESDEETTGIRTFPNAEGRAAWYEELNRSLKPYDLGAPRFRFEETSVIELTGLKRKQLISIVNQVYHAEKEKFGPINKSEDEIYECLHTADSEGRPLYAYFLGKSIASDKLQPKWTREELLNETISTDFQRRWMVEFQNENVPRFKDQSIALDVSALACMCGGFEFRSLLQFQEFEEIDDQVIRQSLVLVNGASDNTVLGPAQALPPLLPHILGEWFALRVLTHRTLQNKNKLIRYAWSLFPSGMARFLIRVAEDYPQHFIDLKLYDVVPIEEGSRKLRSAISPKIASSLFFAGEKIPDKIYKELEGSAKDNNSYANYILGLIIFSSEEDEESRKKSIEYLRSAVALKNLSAMYFLGILLLHQNRRHGEKALIAGIRMLRSAATDNFGPAINSLGAAHMAGLGVEQDTEAAIELWRQAVTLNNAEAMFNLGNCYLFGRVLEENNEKAAQLFQSAAYGGDTDAMINLANCYQAGVGVPKDPQLAIYWWSQAKDKGSLDAIYSLAESSRYERNEKQIDTGFEYWDLLELDDIQYGDDPG